VKVAAGVRYAACRGRSVGDYCAVLPPLSRDLPGDDADSEDVYRTASTISRGSPARWRGRLRRYVRLVLFGTGETVEHGGLHGARSDGVDPDTCSGAVQRGCRGQPSTAWLLATYGAELGALRSPIVEEMLTMLPPALAGHDPHLVFDAQDGGAQHVGVEGRRVVIGSNVGDRGGRAQVADDLSASLGAAAGGDDVIALAGERLGYGPADTAERPSDDHTGD
jgi:hypothetical protein